MKEIIDITSGYKCRGRHIVFEGPDGCGKTTQSKLVVAELAKRGIPVKWTFEPTEIGAGNYIRKLVRDGKEPPADLFYLDREQHIKNTVTPFLNAGVWVIQSRYYHSTAIYQSKSLEEVREHIRISEILFPAPDLIFFLGVDDVEQATDALRSREELDIFETNDFQDKVRSYYSQLEAFPCPARYISLEETPEQTFDKIMIEIDSVFG